jgi:hypothetical protein
MGAGQHPLELGLFNAGLQALIHAVDFSQGLFVLSLFTQLNHHPHIIGLTVKRVPRLQQFFNNSAFFQDILRTGGVIPKTGGSDTGIKLLQLFPFAIQVKETSEGRRFEWSDHQAVQLLRGTWGLLR